MNPTIVADGAWRRRHSPEFQARLRELREAVHAQHVAEWARAGLVGRLVLRWRMYREFHRECRKLERSPGSLYGSPWDLGGR